MHVPIFSPSPEYGTCTIPAREMIDLRYGTRRPFRNKKAGYLGIFQYDPGAGPVLSVRLVAGKGGGEERKQEALREDLRCGGGARFELFSL